MQMARGRENGGGRDSPRQTDLSAKDAGSFTKEHKGSFTKEHKKSFTKGHKGSFIKEHKASFSYSQQWNFCPGV